MERAVYRGFSQKGKVKQRLNERQKPAMNSPIPVWCVARDRRFVTGQQFYGEIRAFFNLNLGLGILAV